MTFWETEVRFRRYKACGNYLSIPKIIFTPIVA